MFFKHILSLKVLIALLLFFGMISLFIGVISINVKDILNLNSTQLEIITLTRIPRLIAILLTGMSLSICGLIMQQLTQNKFVSPTTAGTMDCAKFGILISLIFFAGASFFTQAIIASIFAFLGSFVFIQILRKIKLKDVIFGRAQYTVFAISLFSSISASRQHIHRKQCVKQSLCTTSRQQHGGKPLKETNHL